MADQNVRPQQQVQQQQPKPVTPVVIGDVRPPKKLPMVTYLPQPGDPSETTWRGHVFKANVPREINPGHEAMIEQARNNKFFSVEGDPPKTRSGGPIKTSDDYRAVAVEWFKTAQSSAELQSRWASEHDLRAKCGVGSDDIEYLMGLYQPRLAELKKFEA